MTQQLDERSLLAVVLWLTGEEERIEVGGIEQIETAPGLEQLLAIVVFLEKTVLEGEL